MASLAEKGRPVNYCKLLDNNTGMNHQFMASLRRLSPLSGGLTLDTRSDIPKRETANWAKSFLQELENESGLDSRSDSGSTDGNVQPPLLPHTTRLCHPAFSWPSDITSDTAESFMGGLSHNNKQALEEGKYLVQRDNKVGQFQEQGRDINLDFARYLQASTHTPAQLIHASSFHSSHTLTFHKSKSKLSVPVSSRAEDGHPESGQECEEQDVIPGRVEEELKLRNFLALQEPGDPPIPYKSKRPKLTQPSSSPLPVKSPNVQPRSKEKFGDRVTALQQLVSPFGKTDTASVLLEAIGYIKFLQDQVQVLSSPYMKPMARQGQADERREMAYDLKSRGLCLVPVSCTTRVASSNGADYWASGIGGRGGSQH